MRHFLFSAYLASFGLMMALLAPHPAVATGNVLLPAAPSDSSSNNTAPSLPNLGLSAPAAAPDKAATTTTPQPLPPQTTPPATPAPAAMPDMTPVVVPEPPTLVTSPVDAETAAHLPPGQIPTQIIHQSDMSAIYAQGGQNLPYGLTISINPKSVFGTQDIIRIGTKLGLTREQIPGACFLTVHGIMRTSKGSTIIESGNAPVAQLRYDGMIQSYFMNAQARCISNHVPPGSGYLIETGGRFGIPLQQINCPPPTQQVTQLIITYTGDNKSQCVYQ